MKKTTRKKMTAGLSYELELFQAGKRVIFGMDEAGRGPWAGPVSAAAVALPLDRNDLTEILEGVRDSKELSARQRNNAIEAIKETALAWGVGHASAKEIDTIGITQATKLAMQRALDAAQENHKLKADYLLLDYMSWKEQSIPSKAIIRGDKYSLSIACASVLAKVWRDEYMQDIHDEFPQYGFANHKGYGTSKHRQALEQYGAIQELHRFCYKPIQELDKS